LREFRSIFHGVLFLSGGMTRDMTESHIQNGLCDAAVFGRAFISNPDLPMRFLHNVPLTEGDPTTYYGGVERGYTDYARAT
jgi:N-ethylmaleimide reductase